MLENCPRTEATCASIRTRWGTIARLVCACLLLAGPSAAQTSTPGSSQPAVAAVLPLSATPSEYRIGIDDVLSVTVVQAPELTSSVRVAEAGDISLPLIGLVRAAALTTRELEASIKQRLREGFIREPDVTVVVTEVRSHGVSVVGAVQRPGILQIRGTTTLLEVLSMAGGLAGNAGDAVLVVRSSEVVGGQPRTIDVKLKSLMQADPAANILMQPGDVVNVQTASLIYVMGSVNKPGAFAMPGNERLTVLRALAYGEGATAVAAMRDAVVLRVGDGGDREEIAVDLEGIVKGRVADVELQAQDVLFVPQSGAKAASRATLNFITRVITLRGFLP